MLDFTQLRLTVCYNGKLVSLFLLDAVDDTCDPNGHGDKDVRGVGGHYGFPYKLMGGSVWHSRANTLSIDSKPDDQDVMPATVMSKVLSF